jgi:phospholipid transport system transporter-binding protein
MKLDVARVTTANAAALIARGVEAIRAGDTEFDLSAVTEVDSAAVALLLAWSRAAQAGGKRLGFVGVAADVASLARLYGVDGLLGIGPAEAA